eukprot:CAMPEP_0202969934 /NCGR_PEP_ID=MMETSP1396-20130829/15839_1 /ASSEMBLY_ACC=CAM_ASM_000872 /TAXON_ID= /ORGANISM="Pseudokeronopsis sp., Strain Brazil" /LENGTH=80 /DNA_ID=CAMNT_0049698015 /DNA_START=261 /DNA_END=503 /DNA_ORIENTATION=+
MVKNDKVEVGMKALEFFADSLNQLFAVFDDDYEGGDFCQGMTFGVEGFNMLGKIASYGGDNQKKSRSKKKDKFKGKQGGY